MNNNKNSTNINWVRWIYGKIAKNIEISTFPQKRLLHFI